MRLRLGTMGLCVVSVLALGYADDARSTLEPQQPAPLQANPKSPADHATLLHPDQLQTLIETEAVIQSVNSNDHTLSATDRDGKALTLQTTANTRILDSQNRPYALSDLKPKDHVRLYYDRKSNTLQQIDRLATVGEVILGK